MQALQFRRFLEELQRWGVRLLVTSRCQLGGGITGARQVHLAKLAEQDAITLLRFEAGEQPLTDEQATRLAGVCGCNALALTIIGGFIACQRVTAQVRFARYRNQARCMCRCPPLGCIITLFAAASVHVKSHDTAR